MPFNGSGGFSPLAAPVFPAVSGTTIASSYYNQQLTDIFSGLGQCVTRDGQSPATANLPMGGNKHTGVAAGTASGQYLAYGQANASLASLLFGLGTVGAPSIAFSGDTNTGIYSPGADRLRLVTGGVSRFEVNAAGEFAFGDSQAPATGFRVVVAGTGPAQVTARGFRDNTTISSATTTDYQAFSTIGATAAAAFTLPNLYHFVAQQGVFGAGSTVTAQAGFQVAASLIGATNNYGFRGLLATSVGRWNVYMDGTAQNYFAGNVGIGSGKSVPAVPLDVNGTVAATLYYADAATDTAAAPGFSWDGDSNTGIFNSAADTLGIAAGGSQQAIFGTTGFAFGTNTTRPANTWGIIDRLGSSTVPALAAGTVLTLAGSTAAASSAYLQFISGNAAPSGVRFGDTDTAFRGAVQYDHSTDALGFYTAGVLAMSISSAGVLTDAAGLELGYRKLPTVASAATATAAAVGKCYLNTVSITIDNGVFAAGDVVHVYNNSGTAITILQGTLTTMRLGGTASTGSRSLAPRGLAVLFFPTATECVVQGSGVA